ncbi:UDP-2,3-diacylglucosamine hydrolase [Marinibactrum halimedae]|uniref:UDP-2,3-diacylglucosamine hydrolase n=2 Tax=Marinibactrum halimedae TaxID=1444977 RepID=A0AA37WME5_9GAMM|nr:UDP-2,3-diacylglucosamine hydrolase [Marinibactrum halimedae]
MSESVDATPTPSTKKQEGDGGKPLKYRAIWISDVHLGTKDCKADALNDFLKSHRCDMLYIVGDFIDGWRMSKKIHWRKSYTRIIRRLLKISKRGTPVYYVTGNHDEFLRKYANNRFDNIHLLNRTTHITADQRRLLVIHGDQFDGVTRAHRFLKWVGDWGYDLLMFLNRQFNRWRAKYGYGYWSFAGFLKSHIKRAQTYIIDYEKAASHMAAKQGYDGIVCGHIHHAAIKHVNNVDYYNTGDWVESCTALLEHSNGHIELIEWLPDRHPPKASREKASERNKAPEKNAQTLEPSL